MTLKRILMGIATLGLAATASATIVSGPSLQDGLDAVTVGGPFPDVTTSQVLLDEVWTLQSSNTSTNQLLFEFAGFAGDNKFGIYDTTNSNKRLELFDGSACGSTLPECGINDSVATLIFDGVAEYGNSTTVKTFGSGSSFGYYLDSSANARGGVFFSQASLNTDVANAAHDLTTDHMIAFAGDGSLDLAIFPNGDSGSFASNEYIIAWEDLTFPNSDYDYSDMVIIVNSVAPVPAPATLTLLGLGLIGIAFGKRRKAQ
jgi:hypothetical protein